MAGASRKTGAYFLARPFDAGAAETGSRSPSADCWTGHSGRSNARPSDRAGAHSRSRSSDCRAQRQSLYPAFADHGATRAGCFGRSRRNGAGWRPDNGGHRIYCPFIGWFRRSIVEAGDGNAAADRGGNWAGAVVGTGNRRRARLARIASSPLQPEDAVDLDGSRASASQRPRYSASNAGRSARVPFGALRQIAPSRRRRLGLDRYCAAAGGRKMVGHSRSPGKGSSAMSDLFREIESTEADSPALWGLGHFGFAVKCHGIVFYVDPRLSTPLLIPDEITNADMILCTHTHPSHMDP